MTDRYAVALEYALVLLGMRGRSVREMRDKLTAKGYDGDDVIDRVIARLTELRYMDDRRFARDLSAALTVKGKGIEAIRRDLLKRGIDREIISDIETAYRRDPEAEIERIKALARGRYRRMNTLDPRVAARRLMGFLARRGFSVDGIRTALQELKLEVRKDDEHE